MHAYFYLAGTGAAITASKTKPKPITIPPSSAEEGAAAPLITPAGWPAEATPSGASVSQQPLSAFAPSVSCATSASASPAATIAKASSPKSSSSSRKVQRKGSPSPLQKGGKRKKKQKSSPRGGKAIADKGGNQIGAGTTAEGRNTTVVVEAANQLDQEQPADADGRALQPTGLPSVLVLGLAEEKRQADIRAAKEAEELAEEEACRRLWYDNTMCVTTLVTAATR